MYKFDVEICKTNKPEKIILRSEIFHNNPLYPDPTVKATTKIRYILKVRPTFMLCKSFGYSTDRGPKR